MGYTPNGKRVVAKWHPLSGSQQGSQARRTQEGWVLGWKYLHSSGLAALLATTRGCHAEPALCEASKKKAQGIARRGSGQKGRCLPSLPRRGKFRGDNSAARQGQGRPERSDRQPQPEREAPRPPIYRKGGPAAERTRPKSPSTSGRERPSTKPQRKHTKT